ncbi:DNA-binding response regulator, OmpR family (Rec-wHTH domains) [Amylolactobacillus amylotrophicus DSM 20534]|uniref:DNA-binding response regulator n=3 Tax=Amylolactobacillus TaxID=2767876 RepID=A0A1L6XCB4_9LACO|nr:MULTISPECIES: response regulator transcription factor [Amylolactobacillus]APT18625.1 DNA-binding response regulator [Amylolactobacillus amylophilus DSM 20533 = JCM 1125]KRK37814.1 DNA-binding response regulator, OmpR family (Rec-wHTH domains) [Amylolactobacillus amylotrophicus DSM 20534]KRM41602.1 DNA-binding response regulator, OmpR family (Rec-wHTH domains) [Amylolactobacillus amylophilus DSM 20533 = JCM 1125]GED80990.1 DNA-binding response regulator [Amylolactobacillus amylophilus]
MKLLIVEDEQALANSMAEYFTGKYQVNIAQNLSMAEALIQNETPDIIILDLGLPDGDGLAWLKSWHELLSSKILILTANDEENRIITGLGLAEDYVLKPVSLHVLEARMNKLIPQAQLVIGALTFDFGKQILLRDGVPVSLTVLEWRLLRFLVENHNQILQREQLMQVIWDVQGKYVSDNTLTVTIKRLREKIELQPNQPTMIRTIRGMGYFFDEQNNA